ncbi:nucleoside deoxyribosyltransferase [Pontibacillus halophilus JSM 076056 = DSM 19796]|uniref:Nucleoside deoxyribosyltransferase n=1 Tax=Pontibacillus halophilus JSM 076056 = DSM 19796 TaxID=1385510 RepID=A0A0A5GHN8_9BACI|nr:nucleoside deoxyribosyltransferase [Pontibacillus halophilus JSM 076056 = DSM 19796]
MYLAAPFFNEEQIERVEFVHRLLNEKGLDVFSPKEHDMSELMFMSDKWRDAVYANDVINILKCDVMVAIYDGNDAGTYFEIGYATAHRIPVIVFNETTMKANLMITESAHAWLYDRESLQAYDFKALPTTDRFRGDME